MAVETKTQFVKKTISLPQTLEEGALDKAKSQHRTFSSYIQNLIDQDLKAADAGKGIEAAKDVV